MGNKEILNVSDDKKNNRDNKGRSVVSRTAGGGREAMLGAAGDAMEVPTTTAAAGGGGGGGGGEVSSFAKGSQSDMINKNTERMNQVSKKISKHVCVYIFICVIKNMERRKHLKKTINKTNRQPKHKQSLWYTQETYKKKGDNFEK